MRNKNRLTVVIVTFLSFISHAHNPLLDTPYNVRNKLIEKEVCDDREPDCCGALLAVGLLSCYGAFKVVSLCHEKGRSFVRYGKDRFLKDD